jgi:N-acetylglucosamine kinase-like BadF-type ATPase
VKAPRGPTQMAGLERLAIEIIRQAVNDYKGVWSADSISQQEAKIFFNGSWFETLCDFLDVDPELIKQKLIKGDM